ncbi:MAG: 2-polyprenylphenol 6-hydroxylase, partial [Rhodospirillales bacterium]|nr:2-polyprenylphenol 6-hydroxylase [Rhodospirillales bacterium]
TLRNLLRLLRIAKILARNDALFLLERMEVAPVVVLAARLVSHRRRGGRPGQRLAAALQEAGPSFIKLGQALSTRSDLLGEEMTADLSDLQDHLPPFPATEARKAIEAEFGQSMEDLFEFFDDQAVAAASIAQVHFAITADGREVAVKVLRPGIESAFAADIELFLCVAQLVEAAKPDWQRLKPVESVRTLAETVAMEMDLRYEAAAADELRENFEDDERFHVPQIDWQRTGRRVLTTERVGGIPLDDREAIIDAGLDPEVVLQNAGIAFFKQVFRDGFFHADLHAGNLFVQPDGSIAAVDFGIMGRLDRRTRRNLGELLLAFLSRDYRRAAEIHIESGWIPSHASVTSFTQACRSIAEPILDKPQNEISMGRLLGQLFQVSETFQMETQPQLLLLQKTMLVGEGTARKLSPESNMWFLTRPLIDEWMADAASPESVIREAAREVSSAMERLPRLIDGFERSVTLLANGELKLHPDTLRAMDSGHRGGRRATGFLWAVIAVLTAILILS